ncbi:uncharacterized protein LOC117815491 isoform X1 [Xyrichtys novacula]|uniref:Uncharacterized protein LOC117815491 isoform X1 n=1 Tax=Xyrichtys novacula TaxID=13765 RepID=A0AAV1EWA2_XYRNO|nr:uncharacterized protein LOC117815491 isoform X1 [Xyrichtys novacula]
MQRYWWPGYKSQLLAELQKQQNQTQFCDILLQTEGISVPAHSCILAALSPYLSQKLSASPSPLEVQHRQLQLQALNSQTLRKIVGLLYSGEVEVRRGVEQREVLSAAYQLGITELVERPIDWEVKGVERPQKDFQSCRDKEEEEGRERNDGQNMQDTEVQSDIADWRAADSLTEKTSCASKDTETVATDERAMSAPCNHFSQTEASNQDPASSSPQSPRRSDVKSALDESSNPTSTLASFSDVMAVSLDNDSNSLTPQKSSTHQLSSERETNDKMLYSRGNRENMSFHIPRYEVLKAGGGCAAEERQGFANARIRGLTRTEMVQQMMEATQISFKVKLRRRTKEELWEVVNLQDRDETLAANSSVPQDDSNLKRPQTGPSNDESPPSSLQPGSNPLPKNQILQRASSSAEPPPPLSNFSSDSLIPSSDCFTPNQNDSHESVSLPWPLDYSDGQIERLLEDVVTGLNILPNLEKDSKGSHHHHHHHLPAANTCQIQLRRNDGGWVQAGLDKYGCCQDYQIQPSCSCLLYIQPDESNQQQQHFPWYQSVTSMEQRDEPNLQGMTSVIPTSFNSRGQILHHSECNEQSTQEAQHIPEVSPLINRNQTQPSCSFSSPRPEDFHLPLSPCLSPLVSPTPAPERQPSFSNSSLCLPAWLAEAPASLQFPLNAITHEEKKSGSLSKTKNSSCRGKKGRTRVREKKRRTLEELRNVKEKATISKSRHNVAERKSVQEMEKGVTYKQSDTKKAPKRRKCTNTLADFSLFCKKMKANDETFRSLNLSDCSVSMSSNNVLFKEREMNTSSSSKPVKLAGKLSEPPTITESQTEKTRGPSGLLKEAEGERKDPETECEEVTGVPHENTVEIEESHNIDIVTVDTNHNWVSNKSAEFVESQRNDTQSSTEEASLFDQEQQSVFSFSDLGEEVKKLATEPTLTNLFEAQACDEAVSDTAQLETNSDSASHIGPHWPQVDGIVPDHNLNLETTHRTCLPLLDGCMSNKISGCAPEEIEKEEEDEEVDVLLLSPERVPQSRDCENGLENVDPSPEEDEDEDAREVDVTGDEAE